MHFGERIKELRESNGLLQRQIAASLEMDAPNFSKIERGERKAKRQQVSQLAKLLNASYEELLTLWLADQVYEVIKDEEVAENVLKSVSDNLKPYNKR